MCSFQPHEPKLGLESLKSSARYFSTSTLVQALTLGQGFQVRSWARSTSTQLFWNLLSHIFEPRPSPSFQRASQAFVVDTVEAEPLTYFIQLLSHIPIRAYFEPFMCHKQQHFWIINTCTQNVGIKIIYFSTLFYRNLNCSKCLTETGTQADKDGSQGPSKGVVL